MAKLRGALVISALLACGGRAQPAKLEAADAGTPSSAGTGSPGADAGSPGADAGTTAADAGTPPDAGATPATLQPPAEGRLYHGVLPAAPGTELDSDISQSNLNTYETTTGRKVAWVYFDNEWSLSRTFPIQTATWVRARGAVPFIRLMMRSQKVPLVTDPVFTLDRINAGEFDSDLAAWADAAKAFGTPLLVEYGTEVNGDWNPWSAPYNGGLDAGPPKFRQAYRHIVSVIRARGADNITWALHYNGQNFPGDNPKNVPAVYYPGDDVVDWVGISTYGSERSNDRRCPTFRTLVDDMLPQLRAATATKPLFIFEFGTTNNNPNCPATPWVQGAFDDLLGGRWPDLRGFSWWNQRFTDDPSIGGATDYLVQDDPAVAAVFHRALTGTDAAKVIDAPIVK